MRIAFLQSRVFPPAPVECPFLTLPHHTIPGTFGLRATYHSQRAPTHKGTLDPLKVILFGSFADGSYTEGSDYDFYIVVNDGRDIGEATDKAYRAVRYVKRRPVDIVVGTNSRFERKGNS